MTDRVDVMNVDVSSVHAILIPYYYSAIMGEGCRGQAGVKRSTPPYDMKTSRDKLYGVAVTSH